MNKDKNLTRITVDIPQSIHKQFKIKAVLQNKKMREIIIELIQNFIKNETKN